jgi:hypothetical protein
VKLLFPYQATTKVCPFREPMTWPNGTRDSYSYCIASECMAWVEKVEVVFYNDTPPFEHTAASVALKGYCGAVKHAL